jgi:hypothetical protein
MNDVARPDRRVGFSPRGALDPQNARQRSSAARTKELAEKRKKRLLARAALKESHVFAMAYGAATARERSFPIVFSKI